MKYLLAFIPADMRSRVLEALRQANVRGLTISEAEGYGQEHDARHPDHPQYLGIETTRKLRLEIFCCDAEVEPVLAAIYAAAHTGHRGDGKVFVLPVVDALRLKTGERGKQALGAPTA